MSPFCYQVMKYYFYHHEKFNYIKKFKRRTKFIAVQDFKDKSGVILILCVSFHLDMICLACVMVLPPSLNGCAHSVSDPY